jgi:hypothetical protein
MPNIGPGNFSNWGATPGIQTLGPPVAVNVPNLCDSTNTTATVAALYVVSTSGGLQVPPEAGGVIQYPATFLIPVSSFSGQGLRWKQLERPLDRFPETQGR